MCLSMLKAQLFFKKTGSKYLIIIFFILCCGTLHELQLILVVSHVGVTLGPDGTFAVLLPNGATCVDHGIPDMEAPYQDLADRSGVAEENGAIFACRGGGSKLRPLVYCTIRQDFFVAIHRNTPVSSPLSRASDTFPILLAPDEANLLFFAVILNLTHQSCRVCVRVRSSTCVHVLCLRPRQRSATSWT